MTLYPPLWAQNTKYPATLDRLVFSATFDGGVIGTADLRVSQRAAGASMSVDIAAGRVVVPGPSGNYLCSSDAIENRAIAPAPAQNTSRFDLVCATVTDNQATGQGDPAVAATWDIQVITGTPAASNPQAPALPANSVALARVSVTATTASVLDAAIREARSAAIRPALGLLASVSTTADYSASSSSYTALPGGSVSLTVIGHRYIWFTWGGVHVGSVAGAITDGYVQVNGTNVPRTYVTNRANAAGGPGQNSKAGFGWAVLDPGVYTARMVGRDQFSGPSTWLAGWTLNCFDQGAAPAATPPLIAAP